VFVVVLLGFKQLLKYIQDKDLNQFQLVRDAAFWLEYSFILLAVFFAPMHTTTEAGVSFAACMLTKYVANIVLPENYRK
jgi:hypothetical protein